MGPELGDRFDQLADPPSLAGGGQPRRGLRARSGPGVTLPLRAALAGRASVVAGGAGEPATLLLLVDQGLRDRWRASASSVHGPPTYLAYVGIDAESATAALCGLLADGFSSGHARMALTRVPAAGTTKRMELGRALADRYRRTHGGADPAKAPPEQRRAWATALAAELLGSLQDGLWLEPGDPIGQAAAGPDGRRLVELCSFDPSGIPIDPRHYLGVLARDVLAGSVEAVPDIRRPLLGLVAQPPLGLTADGGVVRFPMAGGTGPLRRKVPALRFLAGPTPVGSRLGRIPFAGATHWALNEEGSPVGLAPGDAATPTDRFDGLFAWPGRRGDWPEVVRDVWAALGTEIVAAAAELTLPCELALAWCSRSAQVARPDLQGSFDEDGGGPGAGAVRAAVFREPGKALATTDVGQRYREFLASEITGSESIGLTTVRLDVPRPPFAAANAERPEAANVIKATVGPASLEVLSPTGPGTAAVRVRMDHTTTIVAAAKGPAPAPANQWHVAPPQGFPTDQHTASQIPSTTLAATTSTLGGRLRRLEVTVPPSWKHACQVLVVVDGTATTAVVDVPAAPRRQRPFLAAASVDIPAGADISLRVQSAGPDPIPPPKGLIITFLLALPDDALAGQRFQLGRTVRLPATAFDDLDARIDPTSPYRYADLVALVATTLELGGDTRVALGCCATETGRLGRLLAWVARRCPGLSGDLSPARLTTPDGLRSVLAGLLTRTVGVRAGLADARMQLLDGDCGFDPWSAGYDFADALGAAVAHLREPPPGTATPTVRLHQPAVPPLATNLAGLRTLADQQVLTQASIDRELARLGASAGERRQIHAAQKQQWLRQLRRRTDPAIAAERLEIGAADHANLARLEAIVEHSLNHRDPWWAVDPPVDGFSRPRAPGDPNYVAVDLLDPAGTGAARSGPRQLTLPGVAARLGDLRPREGRHRRDLLRLPGIGTPGGQPTLLAIEQVAAAGPDLVVTVDRDVTVGTDSRWELIQRPRIILIDPYGPFPGIRRRGAEASLHPKLAGRAVLRTAGVVPIVLAGLDTVHLPADDRPERPSGTYRVLGVDTKARSFTIDQPASIAAGAEWYLPGGLGGHLPPVRRRGVGEHLYQGALFLVYDGRAYGPWRWTSYSGVADGPSARGNQRYDVLSFRSDGDGGEGRNFCLRVRDLPPVRAAGADAVTDTRAYLVEVAVNGARVAGGPAGPGAAQGDIRIHDGYLGKSTRSTGSKGCQVSPDFYAVRRLLLEFYLGELRALGLPEPALARRLRLLDRVASQAVYAAAGEAAGGEWNDVLAATYYLCRPEERPTAVVLTGIEPASRATTGTFQLILRGRGFGSRPTVAVFKVNDGLPLQTSGGAERLQLGSLVLAGDELRLQATLNDTTPGQLGLRVIRANGEAKAKGEARAPFWVG
jgi:hypothetical protein